MWHKIDFPEPHIPYIVSPAVAYFVGLSLLASRIRHQLLFVLRLATMGNWGQPLGLVRVGPHALLEVCPSAVGFDCCS